MYVRFTSLPVLDQDRAVRFYTEKLGLRVAQNRPYQEDWNWITLQIPGSRTRILLSRKPGTEDGDSVPSLVLTVDDVFGAYRDLKEKGVEFTTEPTTAPWDDTEVFAVFKDTEGNLVMIGTESDSAG